MQRVRAMTETVISAIILAAAAQAQTMTQTHMGGGGSPHVKATWTVSGASIAIEYGRPYLKGREEAKMMPLDAAWRTGADEATIITSDKPLKFGSVTLAPGTYTINTQPGKTEWQLMFGKLKNPGQWGIPYDASLEIGRVPMKLGKAAAWLNRSPSSWTTARRGQSCVSSGARPASPPRLRSGRKEIRSAIRPEEFPKPLPQREWRGAAAPKQLVSTDAGSDR